MVLNGKSSQEYPVNAVVPRGLILCPIFLVLENFNWFHLTGPIINTDIVDMKMDRSVFEEK